MDGLAGPAEDVKTIRATLQGHGFASFICCLDGDAARPATRQGILGAFEELIGSTARGDAVVVYYSGHGGLTESDEPAEMDGPGHRRWRLQYLVPQDWDVGNFSGITDIELSAFLVRLTTITENVTLILDCCHSTGMARGHARVKAVNPHMHPRVAAHIQELVDLHRIGCDFFPDGNPSVVRILAAGVTAAAFEVPFGPVFRGVLTEALVKALDDAKTANAHLSWRGLMFQVRSRVAQTCPEQCVVVEGPSKRVCFETREDWLPGTLPISRNREPGCYVLGGGSLHDVREGDKYAIMPQHANRIITEDQLGTATVDRVSATWSRASVVWAANVSSLPTGARAFAWKRALGLLPVSVTGDDGFVSKLYARMPFWNPNYLRRAETGEASLATVVTDAKTLRVFDRGGVLIREWPLDCDRDGLVNECLPVLQAMARAHHVLSLKAKYSNNSLVKMLDIEFGRRVDNSDCQPLTEPDRVLVEGELMYLKLRNTAKDTTLYFSLLDVCAESVTLLCQHSSSGVELSAGATYMFGRNIAGRVPAGSIVWPPEVPRERTNTTAKILPCTVVVILTDRELDLQSLETGGQNRDDAETGGSFTTELAEVLDQMSNERDVIENKQPDGLRYDVENLTYLLSTRAAEESAHGETASGHGHSETRGTLVA